MSDKLKELMDKDDWELQWVIKHKQDPLHYSLDKSKFEMCCHEILCDCESGMILGENWHGGMTREEWQARKQYMEKVLHELKT